MDSEPSPSSDLSVAASGRHRRRRRHRSRNPPPSPSSVDEPPITMVSLSFTPSPSPSPSRAVDDVGPTQRTLDPCSNNPNPRASEPHAAGAGIPHVDDEARRLPASLCQKQPPPEEATSRRRSPPTRRYDVSAAATARSRPLDSLADAIPRRPAPNGRRANANAGGVAVPRVARPRPVDPLVEAVKIIAKDLDKKYAEGDVLEFAMAKGPMFSWLEYWPEEGFPTKP